MSQPPTAHRYWKAALVLFGLASLSTGLVDSPGFWTSYALDVFGPAWIYILLRQLFTTRKSEVWTKLFTRARTLVGLVSGAFLIEAAQYLRWYEAHYDPLDLVAYVSLIIPCYLVDRGLSQTNDDP